MFEWEKHSPSKKMPKYPDRSYDPDSTEDMMWIHEQSVKRSLQYNLGDFTYNYTLVNSNINIVGSD